MELPACFWRPGNFGVASLLLLLESSNSQPPRGFGLFQTQTPKFTMLGLVAYGSDSEEEERVKSLRREEREGPEAAPLMKVGKVR